MKKPKVISLAKLEVILMPNGEIISSGKTIGWLGGDFDQFISEVKPAV